jgi:hypothetical protein
LRSAPAAPDGTPDLALLRGIRHRRQRLAAARQFPGKHDLGYVTKATLIQRLDCTLTTLEGLERHEGHFLNWYDTATRAALTPR